MRRLHMRVCLVWPPMCMQGSMADIMDLLEIMAALSKTRGGLNGGTVMGGLSSTHCYRLYYRLYYGTMNNRYPLRENLAKLGSDRGTCNAEHVYAKS